MTPAGFTRRSLLLAWGCAPFVAHAQPTELSGVLDGARLSGQGRLTFFGLHVYDAKLWVTDGFKADEFARHPVALELDYARALEGNQIADRSLVEMKKVGEVPAEKSDAWLASMRRIFPDVNKGDRLTGVYRPDEGIRFFLNGKARGEVKDAAFGRLFIGIWLSPRTSEPKLRLALLGTS